VSRLPRMRAVEDPPPVGPSARRSVPRGSATDVRRRLPASTCPVVQQRAYDWNRLWLGRWVFQRAGTRGAQCRKPRSRTTRRSSGRSLICCGGTTSSPSTARHHEESINIDIAKEIAVPLAPVDVQMRSAASAQRTRRTVRRATAGASQQFDLLAKRKETLITAAVSGELDLGRDPKDPEHEELVEWAPDGFGPEVFDLVAAIRRLRGR
jgi:hypothetical protein